jgi:hypothetical protein
VETGKFYTFRHKALNFNGESEWSDPYTTYACILPTKPGTPTWITSTSTSIKIAWTFPTNDGGCPIREYRVIRDSGLSDAVVFSVHADQLENKSYTNSLTVTDFPIASIGNRFVFKVLVFTDFAVDGIPSFNSLSMILADLPSKPADMPTRELQSNESTLELKVLGNVQANGSPIVSYNIEIDDGLGGMFEEV